MYFETVVAVGTSLLQINIMDFGDEIIGIKFQLGLDRLSTNPIDFESNIMYLRRE